jgi:hypothetical protein
MSPIQLLLHIGTNWFIEVSKIAIELNQAVKKEVILLKPVLLACLAKTEAIASFSLFAASKATYLASLSSSSNRLRSAFSSSFY